MCLSRRIYLHFSTAPDFSHDCRCRFERLETLPSSPTIDLAVPMDVPSRRPNDRSCVDVVFTHNKLGCQLTPDPSSNLSTIAGVNPGSEADLHGVQKGDILKAINYVDMFSHEQSLVALQSAGRPVTIRYEE